MKNYDDVTDEQWKEAFQKYIRRSDEFGIGLTLEIVTNWEAVKELHAYKSALMVSVDNFVNNPLTIDMIHQGKFAAESHDAMLWIASRQEKMRIIVEVHKRNFGEDQDRDMKYFALTMLGRSLAAM